MSDVPEELMPLYRRLVWDMVCHDSLLDPETQVRYGLHPASADVTEMEHEAADVRLTTVYPLSFQISTEAQLAAKVAVTGILNSHPSVSAEELDPDSLGSLFAIASFSIIAGLVSAGLLVPNFPEVHFHG
ncbi:hypothetical protein ACIOHC_35865 [Streptomyces sp. NPDC088252]|uniref:hypothetical protein n=1 Tax=Streptomyces sp. NPDC088252 TaxID=3365845 RepID=UPI00382E89FE